MLVTIFSLVSFCRAGSRTVEKHEVREVEFLFKFGNFEVDREFSKSSLNELNEILSDSVVVSLLDSITIVASSSLEGVMEHNHMIASQRARSVRDYIESSYKAIPQSTISTINIGENWHLLRENVELDSEIPYKERVLAILNDSINGGTKKWRIMQIADGAAWSYLQRRHFPLLRSCLVVVKLQLCDDNYDNEEQEVDSHNSQIIEKSQIGDKIDDKSEQSYCCGELQEFIDDEFTPKLGVKTNLVAYGAGIANIGVEIALSNCLSIDVPFYYSPYTLSESYKFRVLAIQPEFRYWLGSVAAGHFFGLHSHIGYFNIAIDDKFRYQDQNVDTPLWGVGASYGYTLPLNRSKSLALEFSVGAGYANIKYDKYYNVSNSIVAESGEKDYWGLTRFGVSFIYNINLK